MSNITPNTKQELREKIEAKLPPCPSCIDGWIHHYDGEAAICSHVDMVDSLVEIYLNTVNKVLDELKNKSHKISQDIPISQYPARSVYEPEIIKAHDSVVSVSAIEQVRKEWSHGK
ncbi:hypothetical protein [Rhodococcus qingshengii]|uniref:hypothetical protein n=1 Tax=Rhodococcus qingshengii TaxID=334542 RepID=UPI002943AF28|nr:hypothetical protein [Rhodococcus qingshengii]WOI85973.1 hypothetical protein R0122_22605 [Rhodococcus qingshengii]